jgi:hypothetical protein
MTRKGTLPAGAAALLLSLALLAPPPGHAQVRRPGKTVEGFLRKVAARLEALWHLDRQHQRGKEGPMTDPNGLTGTGGEEGPMIDPDGNTSASEQGPATDPNG